MGLDGISINQLRVTPERNSSELNSNPKFALSPDTKAIDGLSSGQKVDPKKQDEQNKNQFTQENENSQEDYEEETSEEETELIETIKYDLSRSEKYTLSINDETNEILILEKSSKNIVQRINASELSRFVNFLPGPKGALVNRKF